MVQFVAAFRLPDLLAVQRVAYMGVVIVPERKKKGKDWLNRMQLLDDLFEGLKMGKNEVESKASNPRLEAF